MRQPRLCLHTQTPLVRFLRDSGPAMEGRPLASFAEGTDYAPTPGGVTRMVQALLGRLVRERRVRDPAWISLASHGPSRVLLGEGRTFEQVRLPVEARDRYAAAKGALWNAIHGLPPAEGRAPDPDEVDAGLSLLSAAMAKRTAELHARDAFDLLYTHDFQLLPLAARLPPRVPRLFRWHVPVTRLPPALERGVVRALDKYDAVIVSTPGYAAALREAGVRVPVHASYPYLDETRCRVVTSEDVEAFDARWGLQPDDVVFVVVARLDPMKSQDVAIRALARIRREHPEARLLLVGGGGFSAGRQGLGMTHAGEWRGELERLARSLGVEDRVTFAGGVPDEELDVAYTRARAVLLPSRIEGFGLAPVEGWLYGRPVVVSAGAGVAEIVRHGENGYVFEPGRDDRLADHLRALASDEERALAMGRRGRSSARACSLRRGADDVWEVLRRARRRTAEGASPAWRSG